MAAASPSIGQVPSLILSFLTEDFFPAVFLLREAGFFLAVVCFLAVVFFLVPVGIAVRSYCKNRINN